MAPPNIALVIPASFEGYQIPKEALCARPLGTVATVFRLYVLSEVKLSCCALIPLSSKNYMQLDL